MTLDISTSVIKAIEQSILKSVQHAIGSNGVEILTYMDPADFSYTFKIQVNRYNRRFVVKTIICDMELISRAFDCTSATAGLLVGEITDRAARELIDGFVKHLEKLGLR